MTLPQNVIGVDVSERWIDVFFAPRGHAERIFSTPAGLRRFARQAQGHLVVFEATGGCERPLFEALSAEGVS